VISDDHSGPTRTEAGSTRQLVPTDGVASQSRPREPQGCQLAFTAT